MSGTTGTIVAIDPVARAMAAAAKQFGYGYLPGSATESECKKRAETEGALAWDEHARQCWKVYGKRINIRADEHSIKEGFEIVNFNFHQSGGGGGAVPTSSDLPGPTTGLGSPGWHSNSITYTGT